MAHLQVLLDALPSYVILLDKEHHILLANKATSEAIGLPFDKIIGKYCPRLFHGIDEHFPGCPLEEAVKTNRSVIAEFFDPHINRWLESSVFRTSFHTADGHPVFYHATLDISEKKQSAVNLQHNYEEQAILLSLSHLALENVSLKILLARALDLLLSTKWLALESKGCIFLADPDTGELFMSAVSGLSEYIQKECLRVQFGRCLCGRAAKTQQPVFADHVTDEHETRYEGMIPHGHYCIPMVFEEKTLGVINTYIKDGHPYQKTEDGFLRHYANTLAGLIVRKRTEEKLEHSLEKLSKTSDGMVNAIANIVEHRDPYTAGHQKRVARIACAIAAELGLSEDRIEGLKMAGIIHDIGKIHIPAEILSKPNRLTELEYALIKTHSRVGFDLLKDIDFPWPIAQIVLQHHEKIDGSGYPQSLKGTDILLEARILSVADIVEAIASPRPYRPAIGLDKALEEIEENSGRFYDAGVAKACLDLFRERGFKLDSPS